MACGEVGLACCADDTCSDGTCTNGTCVSCIEDVAFGRRFGCILKANGTVWCSGENHVGQLGFGLAGITTSTRMQVRDVTTAFITDATAIGLGHSHACAVRTGGSVWCWGDNDNGELGNGSNASSAAAARVLKVDGMPLEGIVEVKAGYDHSCGRTAAGELYCWGNGSALGDGVATTRNRADRVLVATDGAAFTGATELYAGAYYNCVRNAAEELWCWGDNGSGQLGDTTTADKPTPILLGKARGVATSLWYMCKVELDSSISCSGWNRGAAFGTGEGEGFSDGDYPEPVKVLAAPAGSPFMGAVKLSAGAGTCALMADTSVYCWGDGQYGQNGTGAPRLVPAQVKLADGSALTGVDRLVAKWPHVCAHVMATGAWQCWGRNSEGEFGDGEFLSRPLPAPLKASCP